MLTKEILDNIKEIQDKLNEENDAVEATKKVAAQVIASVQETFQKYNQTQSVDERLQLLAGGAQGCVKIVEDFHNELEKKVLDFKLQIKTFEDILDRVKKFEEDAGEQIVSIEDEGEKKSDEPKDI